MKIGPEETLQKELSHIQDHTVYFQRKDYRPEIYEKRENNYDDMTNSGA